MTESSSVRWQERRDSFGYADTRVFVPLSSNEGCTIGCKYCYIAALGEQPTPFAPAQFSEMLYGITEDPRYTHGDTLISFGCVDDPFHPGLTDNLIQGLAHFAKFDSPHSPLLQLASKLTVPEEIKEFAADWPKNKYPPVTSVSLTTIANAATIEPNAPNPEQRAANFHTLRVLGWCSIAMMKPFSPGMPRETDNFADLYSRHQPDAIVVGSRYTRERPGNSQPQRPHHPTAPNWVEIDNVAQMNKFTKDLQSALGARGVGYIPVFDSSVRAAIHLITH